MFYNGIVEELQQLQAQQETAYVLRRRDSASDLSLMYM